MSKVLTCIPLSSFLKSNFCYYLPSSSIGKALCWGVIDDPSIVNAPRDELFVQIITTNKFACAITVENAVFCWGGPYGPKERIDGLYLQITGSSTYACGVMTDGNINCWGKNLHIPPPPKQNAYQFEQLACSETHCAALEKNGHVVSWDQFGFHNSEDHPDERLRPPLVEGGVGFDADMDFYADEFEEDEGKEDEVVKKNVVFRQVTVSDSMTCGIVHLDSSLLCWGFIAHNIDRPRSRTFSSIGPYRQVSFHTVYRTPVVSSLSSLNT